jgi:hypothetical protein
VRDLASVGGVEGLALGWLGIMYGPRKLCLLITMSRLGYITVCSNVQPDYGQTLLPKHVVVLYV